MGPLDATREKIGSQLDILREKVSQAQERKHEVALRQLAKAAHLIFPNNNYQERELNLVYFNNKYGTEFLRQLRETLQLDPLSHQIVSL